MAMCAPHTQHLRGKKAYCRHSNYTHPAWQCKQNLFDILEHILLTTIFHTFKIKTQIQVHFKVFDKVNEYICGLEFFKQMVKDNYKP